MRKKTFNRIITAGLTIISLFLVFTISATAAEPTRIYYVFNGSDLYSQLSFKVTQYLNTAPEDVTAWSGLSVSKEFTYMDGTVSYRSSNGNYEFHCYPFKGNWTYEATSDTSYNSGGAWEIEFFIPFADSEGNLFDVEKLRDTSYVSKIALYFNTWLHNRNGNVNKRGYTVKLHLTSGSEVMLLAEDINDVASNDFSLVEDVNFKSSEMLGFSFDFKYYGLPSTDTLFEFVLDADSYLGVIDYSDYGDKSIYDAQVKLEQVQNAMNQPAPDIGSALGNIKTEDMALTGSLFADSKKGVFYTFLTSLMVVGVSLGLVGYVLHGKK